MRLDFRLLIVVASGVLPIYATAGEPKSDGLEAAKKFLAPKPRPKRAELPASKLPLAFIKNERIAFVGNSLAERMSIYGHFETMLHSRFPQQELVVRNFARPADEVAIRQRSGEYTKLDDPLKAFGADTFLCFFGFNESFAGAAGVEKFKADYEKFIDDFTKAYPRDDANSPARFVIVSPIAFESTIGKLLPSGKQENANLKLYAEACKAVAAKRNIAYVDIFTPSEALFAQSAGGQGATPQFESYGKFTINGAHLNESGDKEVAEMLDRALFGNTNPAQVGSPKYEKLREAVNDKSWIHRSDYRMLNGWYVYGGRRTYDYETYPREYVKIRNMAEKRDQYIWGLAQDKSPAPLPPDDKDTGELIVPPTRFGATKKSEAPELKYLTMEEEVKAMTVPPGFEVIPFASEREFPELANPDQISFDNKGRLWVSCMPSYPHWRPGDPKPSDRLLILEDTNGDGKADKCTVFYDKLQCPTGFEFWNGGVLVVDEPRIVFLKDTNGDDKADVVQQWTDGWATDDTHHCVNAWEWSHGGLLHMLEGVSMSTTVETPWGALRNSGSSGAYVIDPRTMKMRHFVTPGYGNPWCYVFNSWGQGFCGDGTGAAQHWDTPLSGAQFSGRKSLTPLFNTGGMRPVVGSEFLYSRQFPDNVQGQFIYACVINMNGMPRWTIKDDGSGFAGTRVVKDNGGKQDVDDLISSTNKHFRPVDPQIGPDGALWFGDWSNALIGHMQYSQRDPNRDHTHGRVYRLVYKDKPLLKPVTQFGKTVPELLDQMKEYEPRTRYRARNEIRSRSEADVVAGTKSWVSKLDPNEKEYDRLLLEALWSQQSFHVVDVELLKKVLASKVPEARAAAVHMLSDERDFIPDAFAIIKPMVNDENGRVRLEAVRAFSFYPTKESALATLEALKHPTDYWLTYTIESTLGALKPVWEDALKNKEFANDPNVESVLNMLKKGDLVGLEASKHIKPLLNPETPKPEQEKAYAALEKMKGNAQNGFDTMKKNVCIACHVIPEMSRGQVVMDKTKKGQVETIGTQYGPDLFQTAKRNTPRELIESIIDPSAKMDAKYVTVNVKTNDGQLHSGFVVSETADVLTLKVAGTNPAKEPPKDIAIKKSDIKARQATKQSSMPEGLAGTISPGEFLDIIEYLKVLK